MAKEVHLGAKQNENNKAIFHVNRRRASILISVSTLAVPFGLLDELIEKKARTGCGYLKFHLWTHLRG
mgnify:CR=1 FL=1